jgi:N-acetyl-anhydromuramyl-L-alanine amidase AmpD
MGDFGAKRIRDLVYTNLTLPATITTPFALALIGYDVKDTTAAILAFKRHFRKDSTAVMNDLDRSVLAQLVQNKLGQK